VTLVNQKGSLVLGYEQQQIIGKNWFNSFIPESIKDETKTVFNRLMIGALGYKTKTVSSGEEAVEYLKENNSDLILLDMIMDPGINGRETYERIKEIHPNQKAIIISGFAETDEVKEAQKLGVGKYIKKPFTLEMIGIAVKEELKK
jgi:DNA-binding NtrC family response regulator